MLQLIVVRFDAYIWVYADCNERVPLTSILNKHIGLHTVKI